MYGPTMRGGMTFRIGVPGAIRAGCAGSRTAEPNGRAPFPHIVCAWEVRTRGPGGTPKRRRKSPDAGVARACAAHILPGGYLSPAAKRSIRDYQYETNLCDDDM